MTLSKSSPLISAVTDLPICVPTTRSASRILRANIARRVTSYGFHRTVEKGENRPSSNKKTVTGQMICHLFISANAKLTDDEERESDPRTGTGACLRSSSFGPAPGSAILSQPLLELALVHLNISEDLAHQARPNRLSRMTRHYSRSA